MDEGIDPQNMCHHLYGAMGILNELSAQASEGLIVIFQEWLEEVEQECSAILEKEPSCSSKDMARRLGIPEDSAAFIVNKLKSKEVG